MWWLKILLPAYAVLAQYPDDVENEKRWKTWAEILGSEPPKGKEVPSAEYHPNRAINGVRKESDYHDYDRERYSPEYNDYDESFFENSDYIYVDTEDENYVPPKVEEDTNEIPQKAERRTFDFLYHLFNDQFRNGESDEDGRPARATTPRRPSLIEEIFQTIDNHIVEDLREWSTYTAQRDAQVVNSEPGFISDPSIQPIGSNNDIVLVTDEQGNQNVVTINDIVSSLGHLDEQTLTNLLLNPDPSFSDRSSEIHITPSTNFNTAETQNIPVVLGTQKVGQLGTQRQVRHTGPTVSADTEDEEVYVVQDENGNVQLVTLENIISSLAELDDDSLTSLLFQDSLTPSVVVPPSTNDVLKGNPKTVVTSAEPNTPAEKPSVIPPAVLSVKEESSETKKTNDLLPSASTGFDGNLRVMAHPGSVTVDLKDLSWHASADDQKYDNASEEKDAEEAASLEEKEKPAPLFIGGSIVETDGKGDIYITPDPDKPFTLDIQNIIALAEKAESSSTVNNDNDKTTNIPNSLEKEEEKEESEEEPRRGQELLSYLAGVEEFLPAAILPSPIRSNVPSIGSGQGNEDPTGVNGFRASLLQAVTQQQVAAQPTTQRPEVQPLFQRLVQPVVQPIVQAVTRPSSQSSSEGIGATFSRLFSNLVGPSTPQQQTQAVPRAVETSPEFIKLVVRQQAPNTLDTYYGDVTIPLPQPIHFQPNSKPVQAPETTVSQITPRADLPSLLSRLSPAVQRSIRLQANNVPRFIPPGARTVTAAKRSFNTATSRSDSGPVIRTDDKSVDDPINYVRTIRRVDKPVTTRLTVPRIGRKPAISTPIATRITPRLTVPRIEKKPAIPTVTKKPALSLSSVLSGLPPKVLESLKQQVRTSQTASRFIEERESEESDQEAASSSGPRDRSSYATLPEYHHEEGGYDYGGHTDYKKGSDSGLFDIYLLADLTKVHKIGDSNLSVKSPIIGDPAYFVKTRHQGYYH